MRLATTFLLLATLGLAGCDDPDAQAVRGEVRLSPAAQGIAIGASDALFISARPAGKQGGPPLAVLKVVGMKFPVAYRLGQEDVVMPGTWFRGPVEIRATLRKSGFVSVPVAGDMDGAAKGSAEPGAQGVDIELVPSGSAEPVPAT